MSRLMTKPRRIRDGGRVSIDPTPAACSLGAGSPRASSFTSADGRIGRLGQRDYDAPTVYKQKPGHPLRSISGFPEPWLDPLRDELSVTTAEEFLDLATRLGPRVADLLKASPDALSEAVRLVETAAPAAAHTAKAATPPAERFKTGHDRPPPGHETFQD